MSAKVLVGGLIGLAMVLGGAFLALAGMGYVGESVATSRPWAFVGSLLAGFGVALMITVVQRRH